jgi:drug/metabolite transporter (DMT)-like permease
MTIATVPLGVPARSAELAGGIGIACLGFALFTAMDTMVKWLSGTYPLHQLIFFNSAFALVPVVAVALGRGGLRELSTRRLPMHLLRALIGLGAGGGAFFAYSRMPLADAYAVLFSAPLFVTALSVPILKEPVGPRRWAAVGVGFIGILIMLRPGSGIVSAGLIGALCAAICGAVSTLLVRRLAATETSASIAFYSNLTVVVGAGALLPFDFVPPAPADLAIAAAAGLTGGTALILIVSAYRRAPAAVIAPFQYSQMIWGVAAGFIIWHDVPDAAIAVGCAIVIASGLYILHRETVRRRPLAAVAPAAAERPPG